MFKLKLFLACSTHTHTQYIYLYLLFYTTGEIIQMYSVYIKPFQIPGLSNWNQQTFTHMHPYMCAQCTFLKKHTRKRNEDTEYRKNTKHFFTAHKHRWFSTGEKIIIQSLLGLHYIFKNIAVSIIHQNVHNLHSEHLIFPPTSQFQEALTERMEKEKLLKTVSSSEKHFADILSHTKL